MLLGRSCNTQVRRLLVNWYNFPLGYRAIRGTDESVYAEGAGVGGRNWVNYWGANNWEDNTGHTNHKVKTLYKRQTMVRD